MQQELEQVRGKIKTLGNGVDRLMTQVPGLNTKPESYQRRASFIKRHAETLKHSVAFFEGRIPEEEHRIMAENVHDILSLSQRMLEPV